MSKEVSVRDYNRSQLALIKRTVAKECSDDEFDMFIEVCRRAGFDPFRKQVYAFVFNKDKPDKRQLTIVTGIDGYRAVAARQGDYRPDNKPSRVTYLDDLKNPDTNPLGIDKAEVSVFRRIGGEWHEFIGEAYWEEFVPLDEEWEYDPEKGRRVPTGVFKLKKDSWRRMPRLMISKCAEAQALRKGWPEDLSGVYTEEEMHQAFSAETTASEAVKEAERERREALVRAKDTVPILWSAGEPIVFEATGGLADKIAAFAQEMDSPIGLTKWRDMNQAGLRQFWAVSQADALEVKEIIEKRIKELEDGKSE